MNTFYFNLDLEDVDSFAELSGDYNPLHLNSVYARRTMAGERLSHGVLALLCAIGRICKDSGLQRVESLNFTFQHGIVIGAGLTIEYSCPRNGSYVIRGLQFGIKKFSGVLNLSQSSRKLSGGIINQKPERIEAFDSDLALLEYTTGEFEAKLDLSYITSQRCGFSFLEPEFIFAMAAVSYTVGMRCPGKRSILTRINLHFEPSNLVATFQYAVKHIDERFKLINIKCLSKYYSAEVEAHQLPAAVTQPLLSILKKTVKQGQFSGQQALVVGGSRGLGELTAKLLALGGAKVVLTFNRGEAEAQAIVKEACEHGYNISATQYDVNNEKSLENLIHVSNSKFTHCYYFATPRISDRNRVAESAEKFNEFIECYVWGVQRLFELLIKDGTKHFLYPSTIFLNTKELQSASVAGMLCYAMAKAAGETLCNYLVLRSKVDIYTPRLPKLNTDQTQSFINNKRDETVSVILQCLNKLQKAHCLNVAND